MLSKSNTLSVNLPCGNHLRRMDHISKLAVRSSNNGELFDEMLPLLYNPNCHKESAWRLQ